MEIDIKGRVTDAEHITEWRLRDRDIDIIMDTKAEFTVSCKTTREAKELLEYIVDKVNESHGCIVKPDPFHNNKYRNLVSEIRKLRNQLWDLEYEPPAGMPDEERWKKYSSMHRKLKLLEWDFITLTGCWYHTSLVDSVEKLERYYKEKAELEDEREIKSRSHHNADVRYLTCEIVRLQMKIESQEETVRDWKKHSKAPTSLDMYYPTFHINEDGSLMECPPPPSADSEEPKEITVVIQKQGYHSMY